MGLTDLKSMDLDGRVLELPIGGRIVPFKAVSARFGRAFRKAATTGSLDTVLLPDARDADEYKLLMGDHYEAMLDELDDPEWNHVVNTLSAWILFGQSWAEQVWERKRPETPAPAAGSSAGARARTASTSGTSTKTAARSPRKTAARASGGKTSSRTKT